MKTPAEMSDLEFLEWVLRTRATATTNEVLRESFRIREVGMTVHSRAADLRRKLLGDRLTVECRPAGKNARTGRQEWEYSLQPLRCAVVIEAGGQVALAV